MVNQEKHKVDTQAAAEWLHQKIEAAEIKVVSKIETRPKKSQSEHISSHPKKFTDKLPPLRGASG